MTIPQAAGEVYGDRRSALARDALVHYGHGLDQRARSRSYRGPENAEIRARLRTAAREALALADDIRAGEIVVDDAFAGSGA